MVNRHSHFRRCLKNKRMKAVLLSMVCTAVICSPAGYVSAQTHTIRLENSVGQLPDSNHQNPNGQLPDSNNQNPNKQLPDGNHPDSNGQMPDRPTGIQRHRLRALFGREKKGNAPEQIS